MKLLFDCTELSYFLEKNGHRAGVFYVALNIFRELKKREDIEITFVCNFKRYYFMKEVIEKISEFKGIKLLEEKSVINKFWGKLNFWVKNCPKKIVYGVLSLSRYYENLFYIKSKKNSEQIGDFEYYFSPFTPPSEEILESNYIKRFMMIHDVIPILENNNKIPKNPRVWSYRLYNTINENDFYVTNSNNTRSDVLKFFPFIKGENIKTTYLGANEIFKPKEEKNGKEKYIFSLCTLGKRKNIIFGIRNFFKFIEKHNIQDLKLILAGGVWNKFQKELSKTIAEFDSSKIELIGYVEEENLPKWYSGAMFFIYPSLYEGFGLPVLEAMQCACPVITSKVSSLPEVVGEAGIQINPNDDEEMVKAYEKMYFDSSFREDCAQKGLERAKQFSWKKCTSELLEFMKEKSV